MVEIDLVTEKLEIVRRYRLLLKKCLPFAKKGDTALIRKAFQLSLNAHKDMRRKSGEPYIYHPISVAQICVDEIGLGTTSVICALLHDVVEDTEMELEEIQRDFGPKVATIVDGLTKISGVFDQNVSLQAENFRKMLLTLSDDVRVILIKLADRLHNMRTLDSMPRESQLKISSETIYLYAPLAHRLGLYAIKSELEDLCLKYTDNEVYKTLANKLQETKEVRNKFIRDFINPVKSELIRQDLVFEIKGRPKSIYSIWNKMKKQQVPFEEVYDLFAIRIILDSPSEREKTDCWKAYSVITDFYQPNPDRLRDWISIPKVNGYESLHTTVMSNQGKWVEVQIRSKRMDEIAEKGFAAHYKYKDPNSKSDTGLNSWLGKIRDLLSNLSPDTLDWINDFRMNMFADEVFVFTPKGELKTLPLNSTALDFAFDIHTQVGLKCIGAKVNQKLVPLSHPLKNGDQVEILTSQKQKPSEDWMKFVVTAKAKTKIKEDLREQKKKDSLKGEEMLKKKLKSFKVEFNQPNINKLLAHYKITNAVDLFFRIGVKTIDLKSLKDIFSEEKKKPDPPPPSRNFAQQLKELRGVDEDSLLIGDDMDKIDYTLAKCCNPIQGDDVFGFVTINEGIKIHRANCPNAIDMMSNYGYRIIKAKWTSQREVAFLTGLKITGLDSVGIINNITKVISNELKVNMRSITVDSDDGMFDGKIMLYVNDTKHLETLILKMKKINGILTVNRF